MRSDEYFRNIVAKSRGKFRTSTVEVEVGGLTASAFATWWHANALDCTAFLDLHPEHYSCKLTASQTGQTVEFVERLWGHVTRVYVDIVETAPTPRGLETEHVLLHAATLRLGDMTQLGESLHSYFDLGGGAMLARYEVQVPAALPPALQSESERHLVHEVTQWFAQAKAAAAKVSEVSP
jgi:hypothetical protein